MTVKVSQLVLSKRTMAATGLTQIPLKAALSRNSGQERVSLARAVLRVTTMAETRVYGLASNASRSSKNARALPLYTVNLSCSC